MSTLDTGRKGERIAAHWLKRHGCRILERNYRAGRYEIDLIAAEKTTGTVIFVEVKTRTEGSLGRPADAVNASKRRFLRLAADRWRIEHDAFEQSIRFDVIEVLLPDGAVNRIENAF